MGSCSTTGSASSTRFELSNIVTQRGRSYASGTGLTSGAVFGRIAGEVLRGTRDLLIDSGAVWIYVI